MTTAGAGARIGVRNFHICPLRPAKARRLPRRAWPGAAEWTESYEISLASKAEYRSHRHQMSRAHDEVMSYVTNVICGDWRAGTVIGRLRWVKCPAKTCQAPEHPVMEKEATRAHNSAMSVGGRLAVRFRPPVNERRALIWATHAARRSKSVRRAAPQSAMTACIVDASVRPAPDGRQARRVAAPAEAIDCPRAERPSYPAQKAHATVRSGGVRLSRQGLRCGAFGRGLATYLAADGALFHGKQRFRGYHGARASEARRTCK
jgi:hypothetical protein